MKWFVAAWRWRGWPKVSLVVGFAAGMFVFHALDSAIDQINMMIFMSHHANELEKIKKKTGRYPDSYFGFDLYHEPILYFSNGVSFLAVGLGQDGERDQQYRLGDEFSKDSNCFSRSRDTILTEEGLRVYCAK